MTNRPKPPAFPRLPVPPPAYGTPEWEERMRAIRAYIDKSCEYYLAKRKRPPLIGPLKPGPWWRPPRI
jgi:hypothetical protein